MAQQITIMIFLLALTLAYIMGTKFQKITVYTVAKLLIWQTAFFIFLNFALKFVPLT